LDALLSDKIDGETNGQPLIDDDFLEKLNKAVDEDDEPPIKKKCNEDITQNVPEKNGQCLQPYRNPTRNPGFFNKPNPKF
jgi:hypothetical protein